MTRRLAIAAVALGIPLLAADGAVACSCVSSPPREKLAEADGAVTARLLRVEDDTDFVYRIGRVHKRGPGLRRGRRLVIESTRDDGTCGLPDRTGKLYGLFLFREDRRWQSNSCLVIGPRRLRRAAEAAAEPAAGGASPCSA